MDIEYENFSTPILFVIHVGGDVLWRDVPKHFIHHALVRGVLALRLEP